MKSIIKKRMIAISSLLLMTVVAVKAQVTPSTSEVKFVCSSGTITLPVPSGTDIWEVRYSETVATDPHDGVTLTGNEFTPSYGTGYYYLYYKNADGCYSDPQEVPVYVLAPLAVTLDAEDYCSEAASTTTFTATVDANDPNVVTYAYQWYTVNGGTENAIVGATNSTYTPTEINPNTSTTYRVKAGYLMTNGDKYCSNTAEKEIKVLPKPTTPTITIENTPETW